ncbi:MAG: spore maturation protein [Desulfobacterales bacterium]|jgi:spore maturation protein SpmA|nr:spore maturation protein [Desulfobacterales bacterium]
MNLVFAAIVLTAVLTAAARQIGWVPVQGQAAPMEALSTSMVDSAAGSVELALGLVGVMTLFLGLMKVAEAGGLLTVIARLIRPLMTRLFPDVPAEHPAMGAMVLNLSANALGLGNAATPFGIRAMQELNRLNPHPGTATDAMALFLAVNTSSVTLLPTGVIALRAAAGSTDPAGILPTTLFATACSTVVAILAAKLMGRIARGVGARPGHPGAESPAHASAEDGIPEAAAAYPLWVSLSALAAVLALIPLTVAYGRAISPWIMPGLMAGFLIFGLCRRVPVYESFVEGAREGFQVAVKIIPYLVAILVAVGMLRASGALDALVNALDPWTSRWGLPAAALPMALIRPLSGSGAFAVLAAVINDPAVGPDSYAGYLVSTLQGCTETTFYVLAVYFGAVQVRRIRYALAAGLAADAAGIVAAIVACSYVHP